MDGIPVTVKDELHMEGYRRTLGTKMDFTGDFAGSTSWCVKKWEEAGAIVIGKSTMHELGLGKCSNPSTQASSNVNQTQLTITPTSAHH